MPTTEKVFESYIEALKRITAQKNGLLHDLRDLRMKRMLTDEQVEKVIDTTLEGAPDDNDVPAELMEQARKDLAEYEKEVSKSNLWTLPQIIPRSEAILRLQEIFAQELIRPATKGFVFEGFKGLNTMTNKELSERLSADPPCLDHIVWYDHDFQLLFGNIRQADEDIFREMGLLSSSFSDEENEDEDPAYEEEYLNEDAQAELRHKVFNLVDGRRCSGEQIPVENPSRLTMVIDVLIATKAGTKENVTLTEVTGAVVVYTHAGDKGGPATREDLSKQVTHCIEEGNYVAIDHVIKRESIMGMGNCGAFVKYLRRKVA